LSDAPSHNHPGQSVNLRTAQPIDLMRQHAIEALQKEMELLQRIRATGTGLLAASERIVNGFAAMANSVAENMLLASQNVAAATPDALLNPLEKFSRCIEMLSVTQERVMRMTRLLVGAPQHIVENRATGHAPDAADGEGIADRLARLTGLLQTAGIVPGPELPPGQPRAASSYVGEESNAEHPIDAATSQLASDAIVQDDAPGKPWPKAES
jgi:hypothetical protein